MTKMDQPHTYLENSLDIEQQSSFKYNKRMVMGLGRFVMSLFFPSSSECT